jgi:2,3-bisphosphoglycerate-dependent phosphoglycerate mutase
MLFTLVRHAQPEWIRDGRTRTDPQLTDLGRMQAERVGRRFLGEHADELLVSTMACAGETVEPIADALGLEPRVCPWLCEIANPPWEGEPAEYVDKVFREQRAKPVEQLWDGLEGGESFHGFHRRVTHGLQEFLDDAGCERVNDEPSLWKLTDPDHRIVIVAHAGTNAVVTGYLLGIPPVPWEWERFTSCHASVSTIAPIEISGLHAYSLARFADVAHLAPGLHTF